MWPFKKKESNTVKCAKRAFECIVDSFKENLSHPCPDWTLKHALEVRAAELAKTALLLPNGLSESTIIGLNHIVDFHRLKKEGKPIPIEYFEKVISSAHEELK